jgi:hypothetical protein
MNQKSSLREVPQFVSEALTGNKRINYSGGETGILNLLDAKRQYEQARLGYVRAEAQRYQNTIQLLVAMGGGWWDAKLAMDDSNDLDGWFVNDGYALLIHENRSVGCNKRGIHVLVIGP